MYRRWREVLRRCEVAIMRGKRSQGAMSCGGGRRVEARIGTSHYMCALHVLFRWAASPTTIFLSFGTVVMWYMHLMSARPSPIVNQVCTCRFLLIGHRPLGTLPSPAPQRPPVYPSTSLQVLQAPKPPGSRPCAWDSRFEDTSSPRHSNLVSRGDAGRTG